MPSIAPFSTPGRFWRGNLHTHSTLSDGALAPEAVVAAYKRDGYDFLQLSEHFLDRFGWPIADTRAFRSNDFTTLIGAELHAMATSVGELWHILAVGLPLDFPPPRKAETGPELARRAREAGAFVAIAHPAWSQLTEDDGRALDAAHAVEIYNHGCAVETDRGDGFYLLDQLCNLGRRLDGDRRRRRAFQPRRARRLRRLRRGQGGEPRTRGAARRAEGRRFLRQPGPAPARRPRRPR